MLAQRIAEASTEVGLATTPAAFDAACRLVHDRYVERGYMARDPHGVRVGAHHTLPSTRVFVARAAGRVVGTVALVADSAHGLPCDALYRREVDVMRAHRRRLAEVSSLAVAEETRGETGGPLRALVHALAVFAARIAGIDTLCITVNPRHVRFYERRLGFVRFGPQRAYDAVNGAPAVPLALDLRRALATPRADAFALDGGDADRLAARLRGDLARLKSLHRAQAIRGPVASEVC